jgi:hypothetical protein
MNNDASEMTLEALRSVPLFASLDDQTASALRRLLKFNDVALPERREWRCDVPG